MRLEPDCVRNILLAIESLDFGRTVTIRALSEMLPQHPCDQLEYTCLKLAEGDLIQVSDIQMPGRPVPSIKSIDGLTYKGHEFLSNIRSDNIWSGVKSVGAKIGISSVSGLTQIASSVVAALIKAHFGL